MYQLSLRAVMLERGQEKNQLHKEAHYMFGALRSISLFITSPH